MKRNVLTLGKIDYNGRGRKINLCEIDWELKNGRFSMSAGIWNGNHTDYTCCGQCVDEVCKYFPHNQKAQRMLAIWKEWHLNDLTAGSPAQEAWIKEHPLNAVYPESHYDLACKELGFAGLNPDPNYLHNGKPYSYGSAWLTSELPADVIAEIESWSLVVA